MRATNTKKGHIMKVKRVGLNVKPNLNHMKLLLCSCIFLHLF